MRVAALIALIAKGYLGIGILFACWFAWRGAGLLDPVAARGSLGFRVFTLPGAVLLWPYLLARAARIRSDQRARQGD